MKTTIVCQNLIESYLMNVAYLFTFFVVVFEPDVCVNGGTFNIDMGFCDCLAEFTGANCEIGKKILHYKN